MGKPTGFMEYPQKKLATRDPATRVKDFDEFAYLTDEEERKRQGRTLHGLRCALLSVELRLSGR